MQRIQFPNPMLTQPWLNSCNFDFLKKFGARRQSLDGDWGIGGQVNKVINKVYVSIN